MTDEDRFENIWSAVIYKFVFIKVIINSINSMWWKLLLIVFCLQPSFYVVNCLSVHSAVRTERTFKYTIDELLNNAFSKKVSNDVDLDPCKAGKQRILCIFPFIKFMISNMCL